MGINFSVFIFTKWASKLCL